MSLTDTQGVLWAHRDTVREGDSLRADGGFTCIDHGSVLTVKRGRGPPRYEGDTQLYIECAEGRHYLDGQYGDDGEIVGLYVARRGMQVADDKHPHMHIGS